MPRAIPAVSVTERADAEFDRPRSGSDMPVARPEANPVTVPDAAFDPRPFTAATPVRDTLDIYRRYLVAEAAPGSPVIRRNPPILTPQIPDRSVAPAQAQPPTPLAVRLAAPVPLVVSLPMTVIDQAELQVRTLPPVNVLDVQLRTPSPASAGAPPARATPPSQQDAPRPVSPPPVAPLPATPSPSPTPEFNQFDVARRTSGGPLAPPTGPPAPNQLQERQDAMRRSDDDVTS